MVGIYFLVFSGLYIAENYMISNVRIDDFTDTGDYIDNFRLYQYLVYAHVIWMILAWGIAIWYCIKIVFVKRKNTTDINNSSTQ
jgi:hypothetical protein